MPLCEPAYCRRCGHIYQYGDVVCRCGAAIQVATSNATEPLIIRTPEELLDEHYRGKHRRVS